MRQLSESDALFIASEGAHAASNVSLVQIYDPSTAPGGRMRFKGILALVASRLHLSPIFRQKLRRVPFGLDEPYWIEDENFDLEYHVRHIALPRPGDWRQFCIQASRIHARPLDPNRPLWELYVIEGLDSLLGLPKSSFALLTKLHHATIDVERGTEIMTLLHDTTPIPPVAEPPEPWFPDSPPGGLELVCRGVLHAATSPARLARPLGSALAHVGDAARSLVDDLFKREEPVPPTRFNTVVSPYRVFETQAIPARGVPGDPRARAPREGERRRARGLRGRPAQVPGGERRASGQGPVGARAGLRARSRRGPGSQAGGPVGGHHAGRRHRRSGEAAGAHPQADGGIGGHGARHRRARAHRVRHARPGRHARDHRARCSAAPSSARGATRRSPTAPSRTCRGLPSPST